MQETRNQQILAERLTGESLQAIATRHGITHAGVRYVVASEARRQIDDLELRLLANRQTGELEAFVIPELGGPDFDTAMAYFTWAMKELAAREINVKVHYRPTPEGVVFAVEDVTDYTRGSQI